jgi:hypothetical protein
MIRFIASAVFFVSATALAQGNDAECTREAAAFHFAAMYRDMGLSPQETLERMQIPPSKTEGFPPDVIKGIINTVYFDPDAARVPAGSMFTIVMNECLHPQKVFTPLR